MGACMLHEGQRIKEKGPLQSRPRVPPRALQVSQAVKRATVGHEDVREGLCRRNTLVNSAFKILVYGLRCSV